MLPRINENFLFFLLGFLVASTFFIIQSSITIGSDVTTDKIAKANVPKKHVNSFNKDLDNGYGDDIEVAKVLTESPDDGYEDGDDENDDADKLEPMFQHKHEPTPVAMALKESVRIFCFIMTTDETIKTRAIPVNATWAPRCTKYVFVTTNSTGTDYDIPTVVLDVPDGRDTLWGKTKAMFKYIYENELYNFDWFLKADDDTYIIVENLQLMLLPHSSSDPVYFGCKFRPHVKQGYMSGGSGYVLSREAVKRFVETALPNPDKCEVKDKGDEDVEMGKCLEYVKVTAGDSRDANGRHRMLPFMPWAHFKPVENVTLPSWFYDYMYYPYQQGKDCCSDYTISFHYVNIYMMYTMENSFYHVRPVGFNDNWLWAQKDHDGTDMKSLIDKLRDFAKKISAPVGKDSFTGQNLTDSGILAV